MLIGLGKILFLSLALVKKTFEKMSRELRLQWPKARFVTVPTSFVEMSVPTTMVYFLPINVVRMLNIISSTKYKNVRTLQSFYEWFPQLF